MTSKKSKYKCRMLRTVILEGKIYKIGEEYELSQDEFEKLKGFCVVLQGAENVVKQGENMELEST